MRIRPLVLLRSIVRRVWARAAIYTLVAVALALAAGLIGPLLPFRLVVDLGQDSVGSILQIIASSMLAVTTFSLTAMVTAYSSATTTATPRSTQLLVEDRTSQNALSTFLGAFTFSLVGIVALSTGYYGDEGRTILFLGTLVMIAVVVITLLRWIAHLTTFGRMSDVIDRVEAAATATVTAHAAAPNLHAAPWGEGPGPAARALHAEEPGYVTHVDVAELHRLAESVGARIFVLASAGKLADAARPLVMIEHGERSDALGSAVRAAFRTAPHRSFEQDPRLGVIALSEIGSRALSPSTNDPGTAIEVIAALQRVFARMLATPAEPERRYERVHVRSISLGVLLTDAFRPIARDGAGLIEVQIRLQKCFATLRHLAAEHDRSDVDAIAAASVARTAPRLDDADRRELEALHRLVLRADDAVTAHDH